MIGQQQPTSLTIGEPTAPELERCHRALESVATVVSCRDAASAEQMLWKNSKDATLFDWFVFWQPYAGRWQPCEIERVHRAHPLARLVLVAGCCAVGELVERSAIPGVHRVAWHDFEYRLRTVMAAWRAGHCDEWSLPRTLTATDQALWHARAGCIDTAESGVGTPGLHRTIAVIAATTIDFEAIAVAVRAAKARAVRFDADAASSLATDDVAAMIWNLGDSRTVKSPPRVRHPRAIVLLDFPRPEECVAWAARGWQVVGRPFRWSDVEPLLFRVAS